MHIIRHSIATSARKGNFARKFISLVCLLVFAWPRMGAAEATTGESYDWEKAREFWSFQPPQRHEAPVVEDAGGAGPVVAPVAGTHNGFVGHVGIGFAGVSGRQVVRRGVAGRDVIRNWRFHRRYWIPAADRDRQTSMVPRYRADHLVGRFFKAATGPRLRLPRSPTKIPEEPTVD